jgi:hypothetical protein
MEKDGECRIAPLQCDADAPTDDTTFSSAGEPNQHIARCVGETKASIFAMRWQAIIATGPSSDVPTQFRLTREVYWIGQIPPLVQPDQP